MPSPTLDQAQFHGMRLFQLIIALLLWLAAVPLFAGAGSLVSATHQASYSAREINSSSARLFTGGDVPNAIFDVDVYALRYESTGLDQEPTPIYAHLFIPRYARQTTRPLYVFGAGTTGLSDGCRTSREAEAGVNWGLYRNHMLAVAGQGVIGVLPDYMYFGVPDRLQAYFVPDAEGRVLLDAVRAAHAFFEDSETAVRPAPGAVFAGFSQGGHAIFAAADIAAEYAPELEISGLIGYGPTTNIEQLFREFSVVAAPLIYTYAEIYGRNRFDPGIMLQDRWLENLAVDVRRLCILGLQNYYPWGPEGLFRRPFLNALRNRRLHISFPEIHSILRENSTGLSGHGVPVLILQGGNDVVVNLRDQAEFAQNLQDRGSEVEYVVYPGNRHDTRQIGFSDALSWMMKQSLSQE
ncbi:MAG: hypothetical protein LC641_09680 [Spirochaeta sp.]|nr:hypothetical protein [Spirochaeta sp.]